MDQSDIISASTYINNLLLARGLLRDGKTVDFAKLAAPTSTTSRSKRKEEEADAGRVTAQVMNLVHDLILKRDRDQSQQEHIAQTLITLRTETTSASAKIARLNSSNSELQRQVIAQKTVARTAQSAARTAEVSARALREEVARIKTLLAQVRTQCANDVRKRDVEVARLKAHLSGQQRGSTSKNGGVLVGPSCSINPGTSSRGSASTTNRDEEHLSVQDADYNLRQESNEFLTELSQTLSDENDALIALLRGTLAELRDIQGMSQHGVSHGANSYAEPLGTSMSATIDNGMVTVTSLSHDVAAADLEIVLGNLRELLTNPSFAPIEEVQIREDEIQRLREGWEKMESRWQEAVVMMQGWRHRMLRGGDTVNLDELKDGLNLGEGLDIGDDYSMDEDSHVSDQDHNDHSVAHASFDGEPRHDTSSPSTDGQSAEDEEHLISSQSTEGTRDSTSPTPLKSVSGNAAQSMGRSSVHQNAASVQQEDSTESTQRCSSRVVTDPHSEDELSRKTVDLSLQAGEGSRSAVLSRGANGGSVVGS